MSLLYTYKTQRNWVDFYVQIMNKKIKKKKSVKGWRVFGFLHQKSECTLVQKNSNDASKRVWLQCVVWYISHYCLFPSHPFCPNITLATAYCMKEFALVGFLEFDNYTFPIPANLTYDFITKIHPFIFYIFFFLGKTILNLPEIDVRILKKICEISSLLRRCCLVKLWSKEQNF